uniref:FAD dependent oxidoreductase domain-containing protein n=1 Tax=Bionectria ochroleuca TaxID=29856 RepID=A0A8H7KFK0_BIOOC
MASSQPSYLIIGAGVFGVSTAYHLIRKYPNASVTIVDRDAFDADSRVAASWDWNKIVRADYDDIVYCRMAIESQDVFKSDPLWRPYFLETGMFWMCRNSYAQDVINNYKQLNRKADISAVTVDEARKLYDGLFKEADYTGVKEVLINKTSGVALARDCLRAVTKAAIDLGVKYVVGEAATLLVDGQGVCHGLKTKAGQILTASHTIVCTGAGTSKLLEYSARSTGISDLQAGSRIVAGGIATGMVTLDEKIYNERFASMPVGMQGYPAEIGPFLGSLAPTKDRELKWWGSKIFRNTTEVLPGRHISSPPDAEDYRQWKVSKPLQEDIRSVSEVFYGKEVKDWHFEKFRVCWDAFTTNGDFIVSPHAAAKGLYLATCGSFHGFKFFPVIGKYVIQMLEGELEPDLANKWAWDLSERPDPSLNPEWPRSELNDHLDSTAKL